MPPYSCNCDGSWNQVFPKDVLYVEPSEADGEGEGEEEEESEDDTHFYPMINGINITGKRIDLMPPTKTLLMRERIKELRKKIAR